VTSLAAAVLTPGESKHGNAALFLVQACNEEKLVIARAFRRARRGISVTPRGRSHRGLQPQPPPLPRFGRRRALEEVGCAQPPTPAPFATETRNRCSESCISPTGKTTRRVLLPWLEQKGQLFPLLHHLRGPKQPKTQPKGDAGQIPFHLGIVLLFFLEGSLHIAHKHLLFFTAS